MREDYGTYEYDKFSECFCRGKIDARIKFWKNLAEQVDELDLLEDIHIVYIRHITKDEVVPRNVFKLNDEQNRI